MTNPKIEEMARNLAPYIQAERRERWERWHDENEEAHRNGLAAPYCIHGYPANMFCYDCENGDDLDMYEACPLDIAATTARHMIENRLQDAHHITQILSMRGAWWGWAGPGDMEINPDTKDELYDRWNGISTEVLQKELSDIIRFMLELM